MLLSLRAYARHRQTKGLPGGTLAAVQKAIATRRITLGDGKVDPEVADIQWERRTTVVQRGTGGVEPRQQPAGEGKAPAVAATIPCGYVQRCDTAIALSGCARELAALRAEVGDLRSEVARLRVPRLEAADYAALSRLLPAIRAAVGPRVFSIADLTEHAQLRTGEAIALRSAMLNAGGAARRLGKLFARALGVHVSGLLVQHVGDDREGVTWMVGETLFHGKPAAVHDGGTSPRSNRDTGKLSRGK